MMIKILLICSLLFVINLFIKKKKYLKSSTGSFHQTFVNSSIPLTGGIFISIPIIYFFYPNFFEFTVIFISLFLLGLSSDLNIIESPKKRFLYQFIILLCFSLYTQLEVLPSRIDFLDDLLIGTFVSFVFTSFSISLPINYLLLRISSAVNIICPCRCATITVKEISISTSCCCL